MVFLGAWVFLMSEVPMYRCRMQPKSYSDVSIVIMDLKGFTEMSSTMAAHDLVRQPEPSTLNPPP